MGWKTYKIRAMRTAPANKTRFLPWISRENLKGDLVHASLGLASEYLEYRRAIDRVNAIEELGDICWFCALTDRATQKIPVDISYTQIVFRLSSRSEAEAAIEEIVSQTKALVQYGRNIDPYAIRAAILDILGWVNVESARKDSTFGEVLNKNIAKLMVRFPERFSRSDANDRDLIREREVLS